MKNNVSKYVFFGKRKDNGETISGDLINNYDGRKFIGEIVVDDYEGQGDDEYDIGIGFVEVVPETIALKIK